MAKPIEVPGDIQERLLRGRARLNRDAPKRNECLEFARSNQYVHVTSSGTLAQQNVIVNRTDGTGHRIRQTRNMIYPIVRREISSANSRVPSYDVEPSNPDPSSVDAAQTSEKIAIYGYEAWDIKSRMQRIIGYAVIADEGFGWPYYEAERDTICIRVYGPNEVGWEPGAQYEDSRWYFIDQAMPIEQAELLDGFVGGKLRPDANSAGVTTSAQKSRMDEQNLVMVTEYLERPSKKYAAGRRLVIANGRVIIPAEDYPLVDSGGEPLDEPVLLRLPYAIDPESDRGQGLVRHLVDPQRSYNAANNKQQEWMVLVPNPQAVVKNGVLKQRLTDAPGAVYDFVGSGDVSWRPIPPMPPDFEQVKEEALADMLRIASQNDIPSGVEAGKAIETFIQNDQNVRQAFLDNIAAFHAKLMRRCLMLVQRHFSKPRLIQINGEWSPDPIENFTGAQLKDQTKVRVSTASIEPLTKEGMAQRIMQYMINQWVDPQKGIAAIENGTPELIIDDYERDKATAHRVIQKMMAGPDVILGEPMVPAPDGSLAYVPSWMPRPFDNLAVIEHEFTNWMKSDLYFKAPIEIQEAANLYYQGIQFLKAQAEMKAMMAQNAQAEAQGMSNAVKPAQAKPQPSQPKLSS